MKIKLPAIAGLIAVSVLLPLSLFFFPSIVGAESAFIVQSGSMEPEIPNGSIIFVYSEQAKDIKPGEVITFYTKINSEVIRITHRVVEKSRAEGRYIYLTKGDALDVPDSGWVPEQNVIGEVRHTIPFLGTLVQKYRENRFFTVLLIMLSSALIAESFRKFIAEEPA